MMLISTAPGEGSNPRAPWGQGQPLLGQHQLQAGLTKEDQGITVNTGD